MSELKLLPSLILFFEYNINYSAYDNKKVLQATGYSGNEDQKITYHSFFLLPQYKLNSFIFGLNLLLELNDSNQNYISGYSVDDIEWKKNYYSFTSFNIKPSVTYMFKKDQYCALVFSYFDKKYKSREAQDINGNFSNSKLGIQSLSLGLIYSVKLSKYFSLSPSYMYAQSKSNNKYQKAVSYNYTAHLITLKLNYEY